MGPAAAAPRGSRFDAVLDSPLLGMAPWIVFSVLVGPSRFELSVVLALAITAVIVIAGRLRRPGGSLKLLELADAAFFALMAVVGALASPATHRWLETYAGEVSNIALVVIALGSMAVRVPFTIQYARERVDRRLWDTPAFLRTNYVITGVWGLAFLVAAVAGAYGDLVLHNPGNLWTGWIIQILAILAALRFTAWYPEVVRARARPGGTPPPLRDLLVPLGSLALPLGVVVLALDGGPVWFAVLLIAAGLVLGGARRRTARGAASRTGEPPPGDGPPGG
ncbi:hypothetical protein ABZX40_29000 [Streptomyces sp. NPDC004610]|uniref:hypothetical protein n=1 Tax=unclassified Streptomyces TaxID=2593676 RepID=UPI0033A882CB